MRPHLDCRWPRSDATGERLRPVASDPRPHPNLLGAHALDGERAFDNGHHLWVQYRWRNVPHWTLFLFLWLLVAPLILYLVAALLFPTSDDVFVTNWRAHYYANSRKIFALFGLTFAIDLVDTSLKGFTYFWSLGPLYYGSMLLHITLCAIAATTKSPRYHAVFAVFYLLYNLAMLGSNLLRLM
jgi:hypothetical protein